MRILLRLTMVGVTGVLLLSSLTGAAFAQDPDNGKVLWEEQLLCQKCHGTAGEGGWGAPLAGSEKEAGAWITQIRTPRNRMPHFSPEQVSDTAIMDIQAYLASLPKPDGFTPPDAGLPDDAPASQTLLVEKKCVACHGVTGPINGFIKRGETPTTERVIAQLRTPFKNMPSFSEDQVSDAEAGQITEFLVSQMPPESLPQSGGISVNIVAVLLLVGGGLIVLGATLWRLVLKQ